MWKEGVRASFDWFSWRLGNVPPEIPRATSGGRTPKQLVGVFVVLSLAIHNIGPGSDELNPDDPEEDGSEGDTRCDSGPIVRMNGIEAVVYLGTLVPELRVSDVPPSIESPELCASGAPPSVESPELERFPFLGHE
ncbi:hypothetical protein TIFTF001_029874 [Ficus carica]|uniref:Uncharacterized protein n=1 Tax=Ficus carica TaxID=3494 RepID=A0AA88DSP7_FICCA|nr:hypothetical protein TIFTF001_029874 [Ficus carica]